MLVEFRVSLDIFPTDVTSKFQLYVDGQFVFLNISFLCCFMRAGSTLIFDLIVDCSYMLFNVYFVQGLVRTLLTKKFLLVMNYINVCLEGTFNNNTVFAYFTF